MLTARDACCYSHDSLGGERRCEMATYRAKRPSSRVSARSRILASAIDVSRLGYREARKRIGTITARNYLEAVLRRFEGDVAAAAAHAQLARERFYRLCRKHGLSPTDYRAVGTGSKRAREL